LMYFTGRLSLSSNVQLIPTAILSQLLTTYIIRNVICYSVPMHTRLYGLWNLNTM